MGGMQLSNFGRTLPTQEELPVEIPLQVESPIAKTDKPKVKGKSNAKERIATLNIQVTRSQQRWLQDTAQLVRDNNDAPVPGPDRGYPVHLIQVAIELLKEQDIDWSKIQDAEGLRSTFSL